MPIRSWERHNTPDSNRRIRRHRYQEGPDFLFLATQEGRPRTDGPERQDLKRVRFRMRVVRVAQAKGIRAACQLGCSPASVHRWLAAFASRGIEGLLERSTRPHRIEAKVPSWVDLVIVAVRLHTYWNSKRISAELARRGVYQVSPTYIDRLFQRQGCARGSVARGCTGLADRG